MLRRDNDGTFSFKRFFDKQGCVTISRPQNRDFDGKRMTLNQDLIDQNPDEYVHLRKANLRKHTEFGGIYSLPWTEGVNFYQHLGFQADTAFHDRDCVTPQNKSGGCNEEYKPAFM